MRFHGRNASHCTDCAKRKICTRNAKFISYIGHRYEKAEDQKKPSPKTCHNRKSVSLVGEKGKKMNKKQKITLVSVFAVILVIAAVLAGVLNHRTTQAGGKEFQIEVVSERDEYSSSATYQSNAEYLGEFLRTLDICEWQESDYGIYIMGFDGMMEDMDNQYWWCVSVNGESSITGADEIPLMDGDVYNFTLMQGW